MSECESMRSSRSEETGRKPTEYECSVGFYDLSKIQGKFLSSLIKLAGFSRITHVAPIILLPSGKELSFTVCSRKIVNRTIVPNTKVHDLEYVHRIGGLLVDRVPVGRVSLDLDETISWLQMYTDANAWDIAFHAYIGRFLGLTRPRACTSMVCQLFGLPETWHPADLYRRMK